MTDKMKALILYKDWLMLTRGKIEPRVGDVYFDFEIDAFWERKIRTIKEIEDINEFINYINSTECEWYVEINYNPEDTKRIDFIEQQFKRCNKPSEVFYDDMYIVDLREFIDKQEEFYLKLKNNDI